MGIRPPHGCFGRIPGCSPDCGNRWQCCGCRKIFTGPWQETCPNCGRVGYWTGSVKESPDAAC